MYLFKHLEYTIGDFKAFCSNFYIKTWSLNTIYNHRLFSAWNWNFDFHIFLRSINKVWIYSLSHFTALVKVHLTPQFFFAKTNLLFIWNTCVKNFFDSYKSSIFCAPTKSQKSRKKSPKHCHFCCTTESEENGSSSCCDVYPGRSNISHPLISLRIMQYMFEMRRNTFQRCSRLLQQYPWYKERYTVQFNGDDRSIVQ